MVTLDEPGREVASASSDVLTEASCCASSSACNGDSGNEKPEYEMAPRGDGAIEPDVDTTLWLVPLIDGRRDDFLLPFLLSDPRRFIRAFSGCATSCKINNAISLKC